MPADPKNADEKTPHRAHHRNVWEYPGWPAVGKSARGAVDSNLPDQEPQHSLSDAHVQGAGKSSSVAPTAMRVREQAEAFSRPPDTLPRLVAVGAMALVAASLVVLASRSLTPNGSDPSQDHAASVAREELPQGGTEMRRFGDMHSRVGTESAGRDAKTTTNSLGVGRREAASLTERTEAAPASAAFDIASAATALDEAQRNSLGCANDRVLQRVGVRVTFGPAGSVLEAVVVDRSYLGNEAADCVEASFRQATIPPFAGSPVTVVRRFYRP